MAMQPEKITFAMVQAAYDQAMLLADRNYIKVVTATVLGNQIAGNPIWLMLVAPSSGGKCLGKGTIVRYYDGTVGTVENVKVGDLLMGDDSTPRNVLSTTRGKDHLYRVIQENGDSYIVNSKHILTLKNTMARPTFKDAQPGQIIDIALPDYFKKSDNFRNTMRGIKASVEYPEKNVLVDPYYLGLWLGDGSADSQRIHKPDYEIIEYLKEYAIIKGLNFSTYIPKGKCPAHSLTGIKGAKNPLTASMRSYGLMPEKFIPFEYLSNSRRIRLGLLAGLVDSDGHKTARGGRFEFVNKKEILARNVLDLARSLGFKASIYKIKKGIKNIGFIGTYYQVNIVGDIHLIPTKIRRKQATRHPWKRDMTTTGIKIESCDKGEYFGFELDGNGRFLLGDYTVTHNTAILMTLDGLEFSPGKKVSFFISDLTENTLASGFKSASGEASLVTQVPHGGLFIFKDFTSLLTKRSEARDAIMGQLREVYDGQFVKRTGNKQDVEWTGKIGALAGVTTAVHEYMAQMAVMGDRFIMYSIVQPNRMKLLRFVMEMRLDGNSQEEKLTKAKELMHTYLKNCIPRLGEATLDMREEDREHLMFVADFATKVRSGVMIDDRTKQIQFVPDAEMPTRLIDQLLSIGTALSLMRKIDEEETSQLDASDMGILYKIAFDSIPIKRRWALRELATYANGATTAGLATKIGYETAVVGNWLAQLNALGICRRIGGNGANTWLLQEEYINIMRTFEDIKQKEGTLIDENADPDDLLAEEALRDFNDVDIPFGN